MRKLNFENDQYYHIYNRGTDKRVIFSDKEDYIRFIMSLREFNRPDNIESLYRLNQVRRTEAELLRSGAPERRSSASPTPLVKFLSYALLPNHFHLLVQQTFDKGVSVYMHKLGTSFTNAMNFKLNRTGSLFQGAFQAVRVDTDAYLQYLSAYINGNPEIHKISKADIWPWSSYRDYLELRKGDLCDKKVILSNFRGIQDYQNYVDIVIKESAERKDDIKKYLIENK